MVLMISVLFFLIEPVQGKQPADFVAYMNQIRAEGATEGAQSDLQGIAEILTGQTVIDFPIEDGEVGTRYRSTTCPPPGLSAADLVQWNGEQDRKREPVLRKLKELADVDRSGFVSTEEAYRLRRDFTASLRMFAIAATETSAVRVRELAGLDEVEARAALDSYGKLAKTLHGLPDVTLPSAPPALSGTLKPGA